MLSREFARRTSKIFFISAGVIWGFGAVSLFTNYSLPSWLTNRYKWNNMSPAQIEYCRNQLRTKGVTDVETYNFYSSHDLTGSYINSLGRNIIVPPQFVAAATSGIASTYAIIEDPLIKNKKISDIDRILQNNTAHIDNNINSHTNENKTVSEFTSVADLKNLSENAKKNPPARRSRFWNWMLKDDEKNIYKYTTVINSESDKQFVTGEDWRQFFMEKFQKIPLTSAEQDLAWRYMALDLKEGHDRFVFLASGFSLFGALLAESKSKHYKKEGILIVAPLVAVGSIASLSFYFQSKMVKNICKDNTVENAKLGIQHAEVERRFNLITKKQQQSLFITRNGNDFSLFGAPLTRRIKLYKEQLDQQQ